MFSFKSANSHGTLRPDILEKISARNDQRRIKLIKVDTRDYNMRLLSNEAENKAILSSQSNSLTSSSAKISASRDAPSAASGHQSEAEQLPGSAEGADYEQMLHWTETAIPDHTDTTGRSIPVPSNEVILRRRSTLNTNGKRQSELEDLRAILTVVQQASGSAAKEEDALQTEKQCCYQKAHLLPSELINPKESSAKVLFSVEGSHDTAADDSNGRKDGEIEDERAGRLALMKEETGNENQMEDKELRIAASFLIEFQRFVEKTLQLNVADEDEGKTVTITDKQAQILKDAYQTRDIQNVGMMVRVLAPDMVPQGLRRLQFASKTIQKENRSVLTSELNDLFVNPNETKEDMLFKCKARHLVVLEDILQLCKDRESRGEYEAKLLALNKQSSLSYLKLKGFNVRNVYTKEKKVSP